MRYRKIRVEQSFLGPTVNSILLKRINSNERNITRNKKKRKNEYLNFALVMLEQVFLTHSLQTTTLNVRMICARHRLILIAIFRVSFYER